MNVNQKVLLHIIVIFRINAERNDRYLKTYLKYRLWLPLLSIAPREPIPKKDIIKKSLQKRRQQGFKEMDAKSTLVVKDAMIQRFKAGTQGTRAFPKPFTHWGGGQVQGNKALMGGQSVNGGPHEGGHRPYGGT